MKKDHIFKLSKTSQIGVFWQRFLQVVLSSILKDERSSRNVALAYIEWFQIEH